MAKVIKYKFCTRVNHGMDGAPEWEEILTDVTMDWNEVNEEIAKLEAYNGEYVIEDNGESETTVTTDDVLNILLGVM